MRISIQYFTLLLLIFCSAACSDPEPEFTDPINGEDIEETDPDPIDPDPTADYLNYDSDAIFNQDSLPSFYIELSETALNFINDDPTAEEYVAGSITYNGETISPVGVRYKGSIGAYIGCVSGINVFNPNGSKTCTKLSMKIKFNWNENSEKFYGLKKLQLHSMNNDKSQMRDRLAYKLFEDMGVAAPRCIHAKVYINGEYNGLFALVEQIDGRFSRYHFDGGEGNIYKEIWPVDDLAKAQPEASYREALRTNEDDNPDVSLMRSFGEEIQNTSASGMKAVVEKWMDVDQTIAYCVVDRGIKHDDGPFHWYCTGDRCSNHNYYWYEDPDDKKFYLVAWDMDNAFENWTEFNGVTGLPDDWGETSNNCEPFSGSFWGFSQKSAACDKLTAAWTTYENEYETKKQLFKNQYITAARIDQLLSEWSNQIEAATQEAFDAHGDAISISEWEGAKEDLKQQMALSRNN